MTRFQHFGIIGGGAWGTALAQALAQAGRDVTLWAREAEVVAGINEAHENKTFLPGIFLSQNIRATANMAELAQTDAWLLVAPVQHTRAVCADLAQKAGGRRQPVVICSKGIEKTSLTFPSVFVAEELKDHPLAVLSGPTFAAEVARGLPTALTLACADLALAKELSQAINSRSFRPYLSDDVVGAEIGGAIKNVLAVACGISTGAAMGDNARAALITRGLAEIMRLGEAMGAKAETLMGLSGLGDLVLTCSSFQSRNMSLGAALGEGKTLAEILASRNSVAEGVPTSAAAAALAEQKGVDMPIIRAVDAIVNHGASVTSTIEALLSRPLKAERN